MKMRIRTALALLAALLIFAPLASFAQSGYDLFQKALTAERAEGKLNDAIALYQRIAREFASDRPLVAKALVQMGQCYEKQGKAEARKTYERILREFADQPQAAEARARLAALLPAASSSAVAVSMRQVWEKGDTTGMVSPDGRYVSFTDWSTGNVVLHDLVSGANRPLTSKASWSDSVEYAEASIFSHDGKQVAYSWFNGQSFGYDLRVVDVDGSKPRVFFASSAGEFVAPIGWLPDGKTIVARFSRKNRKSEIGLVSEADREIRVLKSFERGVYQPALSPDGRYIAYGISVKEEDGRQRDIFLLATDGSGEVPLVVHPADDSVFSWAPDGQSLLFKSDRSGTQDLWNIAVANGKPRGEAKRIKQDFGRNATALGLTANNAIFYALVTGSTDVYVAKLAPNGTKLIAPPEAVTQRFVGGNRTPEWSPDGKSLAYITQPGLGPGYVGSGLTVTIKTLDTGKERELHPGLSQANSLRWAPDGKSLLTWGRAAGFQNSEWRAFRIDVNTGVADELVLKADDATGMVLFPRWSSDGEAIYFVGGPMTGRCIFRRELRTGQRTEVFCAPKETPFVGSIELSPDGKWLAFGMDSVAHQPSHVMMAFPIAGGAPRELLRLDAPETARLNGWAADSRSILITKRREMKAGEQNSADEVWRIPLQGGSPQLLDLRMPVLGAVRMHPDGQRIVFSSGAFQAEVWVMENLLPASTLTLPASAVLARRISDEITLDPLGTPSPDGQFLSTTDWETGDLALLDTATGQKRRVTNKGSWTDSPEFAMFSAVSPDGKRIAYAWFNKELKFDLRVIDSEGTSPRVLYSSESAFLAWPTAWTPDGKSVLAVIGLSDRTSQIALISAADGTVRVLKTLAHGNATFKASISPDGRYIAYDYLAKEDAPEHDIFLLPIEGGREFPLVRHPADDLFPVWTPDGQSVVFESDRTSNLGLWRIRVANGKPQGSEELLKQDVGRIMPIGFSSKGSYYYGLELGMTDVYLATLDLAAGKVTAAPAPLSQRYIGNRASPNWSPDGKYLLYVSRRGPFPPAMGSRTLSIFSPETGRERDLSLNLQNVRWARWSPDAREFLVNAFDFQGRQGLFRVDARTGEATPIVVTEPGKTFTFGAWSADAKSVFFQRNDNPRRTSVLVQRDLQTGEEKELYRTSLPMGTNSFGLSPDGQQIVLSLFDRTTSTGTLRILPLAGGEPRDLYQVQRPDSISGQSRPVWTPDGKYILFLKGVQQPTGAQPVNELWRVSVESGKAEKLGLAMENMQHIAIHPDGKRLAFGAGQNKGEIWVMENLLPAPPRAAK